MRADFAIPVDTLAAFLLVMARIGALMMYLPVPGIRQAPNVARVVFTVACTFVLYPFWAHSKGLAGNPALFLGALFAEATVGLGIGLIISFISEALLTAAQSMSLQAGYSYASTIDPNTEAEAGYLVIIAQLLAGLLFFSFGIHRQVIAALAHSLTTVPPGAFVVAPSLMEVVARSASAIFTVGLRLGLPMIALLAMTDIALALMGRLNTQLQVMTISFPLKMMAALGLFAWISVLIPVVYRDTARQMMDAVYRLLR